MRGQSEMDMGEATNNITYHKYFVAAFSGGVSFLLLFVMLCVMFICICVIMRRLSKLSRSIQQLGSEGAYSQAMTVNQKQSNSAERSPGTELSNTGGGDDVDDAAIAAMYAVVPEEHRQKKKQKKLSVQQYDDVNLLSGREAETRMGASASITVEASDVEGYSRLCHAGPRIENATTRHLHSSLSMSSPQLLEDDDGNKKSRTGSVIIDRGYSQVDAIKPQSKLLVPTGTSAGYTLIEHEKDTLEVSAPPLPDRIRTPPHTESGLLFATRSDNNTTAREDDGATATTTTTTTKLPYQNMPGAGERGGEPGKIGAGYSMVANPASPKAIEDDFFSEVLEFHNLQAQGDKDIYEKVK